MELPNGYREAVEAYLLLDDLTFQQIGVLLERLSDAYCEAAEIRNGEARDKSH